MYSLDRYDATFYETYGHEAAAMSKWFLPLLNKVIPFESLVDVGCGEGYYVKWLLENRDPAWIELGSGSHFFGVEGSHAAIDRTVIPEYVGEHDFRLPMRLIRKYDIAFSLEVAEHIEEEYAPVFVESLCSLSDCVVMTAAPPGQGGLMHVNERDKAYWVSLFRKQGFRPDWEAVQDIREGIAEAKVSGEYVTPWLLPNLIVFRRDAE